MKFSKEGLGIAALAAAVIFGGGVYMMANMNALAKNYIERVASDTLGVKVTLGGLEIALQERKARATDLFIANPEGFKGSYALKAAVIDITLGDIAAPLFTLKNVDVSGAEVDLEVHSNVTNLSVIANRVKPAAKTEEQRIIIEKITIAQAQLKPAQVLYAQGEQAPVRMTDIVVENIGRKESGVLADQAIGQVWTGVARGIHAQAARAGLLEGLSNEVLHGMGVSFTQRFKENLQETVQQKVEILNKNIDSMLNE
jgi:hypothetical protein